MPAAVEHPFPTLATKMLGPPSARALSFEYSTSSSVGSVLLPNLNPRFEAPLPIVTTAQFMYISRFPKLLNQVLFYPCQFSASKPRGFWSPLTMQRLLRQLVLRAGL